jgi:GNAT superfamily N-acetyltransferase
MLLRHAIAWGVELGATAMYSDAWDDSPESLQFAEKRGFSIDRHAFQSVLKLAHVDWSKMEDGSIIGQLEAEGIRFITLADVPMEQGEQRLYELYQETLTDIPGFTGDIPPIDEWRKWYLKPEGYAPDQVIIATDGDTYVGVSNVLRNRTTNGMYHEYTAVRKAYRGRKIALALKIKALLLAKERRTPYMRTDNDSLNHAMLGINRRLGYQPLRGSYRLRADIAAVEASLKR